jgi:radical SAM superfamily enzyme YgiQ (UPF0313 family)
MRFLFVHRNVYQDPLGPMLLAAVLGQRGHEAHLIDVALDPDWEDRAVRLAPDAVGYSAITGNQHVLLDVNRRLKQRMSFVSIWGGPHPTFFPELLDEDGVDAICVGEGEGAIVDLADAIDRGDTLAGIPNLHVKTAAGVVKTAVRPLVLDLDSLPFPDRAVFARYPQYRYGSTRAVITSRGCPYGCSFCFNQSLRRLYAGHGPYVRRRSVESIVEECRRLREDRWTRLIMFKDDLFAHDEEHVARFSERYAVEVGLPFTCNVRPDRVTERMAEDLARAGARVVHFGIESGNDRVRRELLRRDIDREDMVRTARWLHDRGVKVYTNNIVGIPGETLEEAFDTLDLNVEIRADVAMFTLFQPYPGTPLGDLAVEMGWTDPGAAPYGDTMYGRSMSRLPYARERINMVHLFPAAARSSLLRRLAPTLMRLPLTSAYRALDFTYKSTRFVFALGFVSPRDVALQSAQWSLFGRRKGV